MVDHPLISLCVGVLPPAMTHDTTDHELSMLSAEAKKQAKYVQSKVFILDDRRQKTA